MTREWTPDEERTLRLIYPHTTAAIAAAVLGRSLAAVQHKAADLGLKKVSVCTDLRGITADHAAELTAHGLRSIQTVPGATITTHIIL